MAHRLSDKMYVIECGDTGYVKIGSSGNPVARLKQLQIGCPFELHLRAVYEDAFGFENLIHRKLGIPPVRGEWYRKTPELVELLRSQTGKYDTFTLEA